MKSNMDFIQKIFNVFLDSPGASIRYDDLIDAGIRIESAINPGKFDDEFLHHISLLVETGLISNNRLEVQTLKSIGIQVGDYEDVYISSIPLHLTQLGHNFADMLCQEEGGNYLNANLTEMPLHAMIAQGALIQAAC